MMVKLLIKLFSLIMPTMMTFIFTFGLFLTAFRNGIVNNVWRVTLDINHFGEAPFELVVFLICLPFCIYGVYLNIQMMDKYMKFERMGY